ncbi:MAG: O-antigen ligase family protein [Candidatus Nomurabacteria bacterium]|nr:O-antigen ligase family protein [Candidatus Nomurabacteria bacterium]
MKKIIKILLCLTALTPLIVDNNVFYPYITGESFFFRSLIFLISILFLTNFFTDKIFKTEIVEKIKRLTKKPLIVSVLVFFFIYTISTFLAVDKYTAFWGNIERAEGFVGLAYIFFFFVFSVLIFEKEDYLWFFKISLFTSFFLLIREFFQYFNGVARPGSFFSNPTFLAGYLLFAIFCSLVVFSEEKNRLWKYFSVKVFLLSILGIFVTGTRGSILGLAIGIILILIYCSLKGKGISYKKYNLSRISLILLGIIFSFSLIFIVTRSNVFWQKVPGFSRVAVMTSNDTTLQTRILNVGVSLDAVNPAHNGLKKFLVGWGPENFAQAYARYFNIKQFDYEVVSFDRAHDKLFDVLVMNGFLGLIAYLAIYFLCFRNIFKRKDFSLINIALLFYGIALFVHLLFIFDQINTYISFFIILAFIVSVDLNKKENKVEDNKKYLKATTLFLPIITVFIVFIYFSNDLIAYAQMHKYHSLRVDGSQNLMLQNINSVLYPFTVAQMDIRNDFVLFTGDNRNIQNEKTKKLFDLAIKASEEYSLKDQLNLKSLMYLANAYTIKGNLLKDTLFLQKGEDSFLKIINISPNRPDVNYGLAFNLMYQQKYDESFSYFEKSFDLSVSYFKNQETINVDIYKSFIKYFNQNKDVANYNKVILRLKNNGIML